MEALCGGDWLTGHVAMSRGIRSLELITVVLGLGVGWLLVAIQQYVWDGGTDGRLPYVPTRQRIRESWGRVRERGRGR
jgi:hypothetical protein